MSDAPVSEAAEPVVDERERARLRARAALAAQAASGKAGLWLLVSLVLFVFAGSSNKVFDLVALCVVILIHELGHAAAMKVFGYRDLKIFFVPFLGGAAVGKKTGAPVWQQSVVLLAGPLPGIAIGLALAIAASLVTKDELLSAAALQFIIINGFNLLPFAPLDGGRLIELALMARHRFFAAAFSIASCAVLAILAVVLESVALGFMAFLALAALRYGTRLRKMVDELRAAHGTMPADAAHVNDASLEALDAAAMRLHPQEQIAPTALHAHRQQSIRNLWESLAVAPPTGFASFLILGAWAASVVGTLVVFMVYAVAVTPTADAIDAEPDDAVDAALVGPVAPVDALVDAPGDAPGTPLPPAPPQL